MNVINYQDTSVLNKLSLWLNCTLQEIFVATQNHQYFLTFTIIVVIYLFSPLPSHEFFCYIERRLDSDTYTTANQMQVT